MQYFVALKIGEKRVKEAQEFFSKFLIDNVPAMPALALKDNKDNNWQPAGEEKLFAVVKQEQGFLIALCDKNGIAKSIANWFTEEKKDIIINKLKNEGNIEEYLGRVSLPV